MRAARPENRPGAALSGLEWARTTVTRLAQTLFWLCSIPSPIGEERELCNALEKRLAPAGGPRRHGHSRVGSLAQRARRPQGALRLVQRPVPTPPHRPL